MKVIEKISIEEFDNKKFKIRLIEPENKAVLTHYLHNINNGYSEHYKEKAMNVLDDFGFKKAF